MDSIVHTLLDRFGPEIVLTGEDVRTRPATRAGNEPCAAKALVRPRSAAMLGEILRICSDAGQAVVPRAGMTGLVDGAVCGPEEIALSLESMQGIVAFDASAQTVTVMAGTPLEVVQNYVEERGFLFPLDLGARGSATIGGNVATNAGGNRVLRYGMMREMVLGLEAVLADGTIVSSMSGLIKNNTGLDIKHLFIGTEGTLGVVTKVILRLWPKAANTTTALLACPSVDAMVELLQRFNRSFSNQVTAFEGMWEAFYKCVTKPGRAQAPFQQDYPFYGLVEIDTNTPDRLEDELEELLTEGTILDAVIAQSEAQRQGLWALRDSVHFLPHDGINSFYDVSLPINHICAYAEEVQARVAQRWPGASCVAYGHIGDGNLHWGIANPEGAPGRSFLDKVVYEPLARLNGSVSAEHGIGLMKKDVLSISRSPEEIAVMMAVKRALDPRNILNPGKIL